MTSIATLSQQIMFIMALRSLFVAASIQLLDTAGNYQLADMIFEGHLTTEEASRLLEGWQYERVTEPLS